MTFMEIIKRASIHGQYHVFQEYGPHGDHAGYSMSFKKLKEAAAYAHKVPGGQVFDNDGKLIGSGF